jgi:hypothetical protein
LYTKEKIYNMSSIMGHNKIKGQCGNCPLILFTGKDYCSRYGFLVPTIVIDTIDEVIAAPELSVPVAGFTFK